MKTLTINEYSYSAFQKAFNCLTEINNNNINNNNKINENKYNLYLTLFKKLHSKIASYIETMLIIEKDLLVINHLLTLFYFFRRLTMLSTALSML